MPKDTMGKFMGEGESGKVESLSFAVIPYICKPSAIKNLQGQWHQGCLGCWCSVLGLDTSSKYCASSIIIDAIYWTLGEATAV